MSVHLAVNDEDKGFIVLSSAFDGFEPLREWVETIVASRENKASIVRLNGELSEAIPYYEPIWVYDADKCNGFTHPSDCGIFSVYDSADDKILLDAFCYTPTFVQTIYKSMIEFATAMKDRPEFIEDWVIDSFNKDCSKYNEDDSAINEIFYNKVKSEKIEEFLNK